MKIDESTLGMEAWITYDKKGNVIDGPHRKLSTNKANLVKRAKNNSLNSNIDDLYIDGFSVDKVKIDKIYKYGWSYSSSNDKYLNVVGLIPKNERYKLTDKDKAKFVMIKLSNMAGDKNG